MDEKWYKKIIQQSKYFQISLATCFGKYQFIEKRLKSKQNRLLLDYSVALFQLDSDLFLNYLLTRVKKSSQAKVKQLATTTGCCSKGLEMPSRCFVICRQKVGIHLKTSGNV